MDINLIRKYFTQNSTIGELSVNGNPECYILEDVDRGLIFSMPTEEINAKKIHSRTCIPYGKYEIVVTFSNRFQKPLPLLMNVRGYEGIRIHPGNVATDTEGCLLPGKSMEVDKVVSSVLAFDSLFAKIKEAVTKEKVFINITKGL